MDSIWWLKNKTNKLIWAIFNDYLPTMNGRSRFTLTVTVQDVNSTGCQVNRNIQLATNAYKPSAAVNTGMI